jgi:D-3-phosphoglycerate dehydrogenase / 2-oxoglutarate reductase
MSEKVLICTSKFAESVREPLKILEDHNIAFLLNPHKRTLTEDEVIALGRGCTGIISGSELLTRRVLEALPEIRCISRVGVGVDNIDLAYAEKRGICVKNTPDAPTRAVAELTVGLMFDLVRRISIQDREIRKGNWNKILGCQIKDKNVGVIGLGRIGRTVAELLTGLGASVSGYDLYPNPAWARQHSIEIMDFSAILTESDIVTIHIPFSKGNAPLVGEAEIRKMRSGAFLLNLSRGGIVDEMALYHALKEHRLAGAAVDTFEKEPYQGPLRELDTIILTPHTGSYTAESRSAMELEAVKNLIEALDGSKDTL